MQTIYRHKYFDGNTIEINTGETLAKARLFNEASLTTIELDISQTPDGVYALSAPSNRIDSGVDGVYNLELLEAVSDHEGEYRMIACIRNFAMLVASSGIE